MWIAVAILAHMAGGGGAVQVARVIDDRAQFRRMVLAVRDELRPGDTTFEILTDVGEPSPEKDAAKPPARDPDNAKAEEGDPDEEAPPDPTRKPEPRKDPKLAKPEPKKPEPKKPEPKKEEAKVTPPAPPPPPPPPLAPKQEVAKPALPPPPPPPPPPPLPEMDHRIAIRQHVEKEPEDNKEANRIADQANKVEEETMAQIRSKDQDDPTPTPGSTSGPKGPKDMVGDSDHDKSAQSEDRTGNELHGPGEGKEDSTSAEHHSAAPPSPQASPLPAIVKGPPPSAPRSIGGGARGPLAPQAEAPVQKGSDGGAGPASPEVGAAANGGYTLNPANPGGDGASKAPGRRRKPRPYEAPVRVGSIGLGAPSLPGGPSLNLSMAGVEESVGHEKLKAERAADGASRRSAHRGSWETNKWEKWRAAIENYVPQVKPGNQTSLNAARVPFATYINGIHNRLHPIFAEEFLTSLSNLPPSHSFNQNLVTHVEIVLNKDNGRIVRMGITKGSGMTAFDIVALNSVSRASPYGRAPDAIVSPDGHVYLHWEFHRDPFDACTTRNARPFLLKEAPKGVPTDADPPRRAPRARSDDERPSSAPLLPLQP